MFLLFVGNRRQVGRESGWTLFAVVRISWRMADFDRVKRKGIYGRYEISM